MNRAVLLAATLLCAASADAQTSIFEYEIFNQRYENSFVTATLRFRNNQGYEPGNLRTIQSVRVSAFQPTFSLGPVGNAGAVLTAPLNVGGGFLTYDPGYFSGGGSFSIQFGPDDASFVTGVGLLGCTIPIFAPLDLISRSFHSGSTCASGGYDGWKTVELASFVNPRFFVGSVPPPNYFNVIGHTEQRWTGASYQLVPEPSTYAMVGAALVAVSCAGRRRRARERNQA